MPAFASACSVLNHQFEETSIPPYYDTAGYRCEQLNCGHPMNMSFRRAFWTIPSRLAAGAAKTAPAIFQHNMCPDRTLCATVSCITAASAVAAFPFYRGNVLPGRTLCATVSRLTAASTIHTWHSNLLI